MSHRSKTKSRSWMERALSLLLAAVLLAGTVPALTLPASAHWADQYLDQLVDWGVMRADQTADPDSPVTRAEFAGVINRAYGYTDKGEIPFEDVAVTDWFYDDISIAYTAGYMAGTSETTASPNETLTREMAVCILGRNMMMKETPGESLAFSDSRDVSFWAQGMVKTAVDNYIVSGYPDNSFGPQDPISRGQMAVLVSQCLGNPISESGSYELGGVFGNVTITAPDVTLRNTTISGDLYVSGGVGLGGIKLENVNVLGRIIVSSAGESEGGDASVIMRNVTADEMLVDNMRNKTVTVRADGITDIAKTTVRTNAYLEDNNTDDKGLMNIELDGEQGTRLTLAGRIKNVVDKTPGSFVQVAKGTVAKLTVDEAAVGSTVQLDRNTEVKEMNLDVATSVTGEGDIGQLNINAPGSVVAMLPDKIYIRPGLTASIGGVIMDHTAAEQGSLDPRLLSGYPAAKDIAPTGCRADFAGNKKGTIYWAVSAIADGSIGEEDLISPPSYGSLAISNGSVAAPTGGEEVSVQVTNLTVGGSYYLSAVLVDEQDNHSPVKVVSFSTPDNTVPAFGQGYPYMSLISKDVAQVTVMPTKSCKLYYALLPQGAQAPTANELKAAAVIGNLGYGVRDVTKNTESVFSVNNQRLEELKTYTLYLWLTDVNGANSSAVTPLQFVVPDETPPEFTHHPQMNGNALPNSVPMTTTVNENATVYWAVVEEGANYPLPNLQSDPLSKDNEIDPETNQVISSKLDSEYAKLCVKSGMGAIARGQAAAQGGTELAFNITGLQPEKAYDLYYLAQDTAGNYSVQVHKLTGGIHTQDTSGPVITQSFSSIPSRDDPNSPLSSTDILLEFSENFRCNTSGEGKGFLELYNNRNNSDADMKLFTDALKASIVLYRIDPESGGGSSKEVVAWDGSGVEPDDWVVNYSNVIVEAKSEGKVLVTFPGTESSPDNPAVKLSNGAQYYFQFRDITDVSAVMNPLDPYNRRVDYTNAEEKHTIPVFTTVFSQVLMTSPGFDDPPEWKGTAPAGQLPSNDKLARMDLNFRLNPQSTENTDDSNRYDVLIYSDTTIDYDLYYRIVEKSSGQPVEQNLAEDAEAGIVTTTYADNLITDHNGIGAGNTKSPGPDVHGWRYLGNSSVTAADALSLGHDFTGCTTTNYPQLNNLSENLYYEFVISVTKNGTLTDYKDFSGQVEFEIYVEAGRSASLDMLGQDPSQKNRQDAEERGLSRTNGVANIGLDAIEGTKHLKIPAIFPNTQPPQFRANMPWFSADGTGRTPSNYYNYDPDDDTKKVSLVGDTFAYMFVNLNAQGTIHYVVSPSNLGIPPIFKDNTGTAWDIIPTDGKDMDEEDWKDLELTSPEILEVAEHERYYDKGTYPQQDSFAYNSSGTVPIPITDLTADTNYYIYIVLEAKTDGSAPGERSHVYVYKFRTAKTTKPRITLDDTRQGKVSISTAQGTSSQISVAADLNWIVFTQTQGRTALNGSFSITATDTGFDASKIKTDTGGTVDTLLKALTTTYNASVAYDGTIPEDAKYGTEYNGLTVFDVFASDAQRTYVENLVIATGSGTGKVNSGSVETRPATNYTSSADWVTGGDNPLPEPAQYLILVAGHNVGSQTGSDGWWAVDSFRAYDGVVLQDLLPPKLKEDGVSGTVEFDLATGELSGDILLMFDKDVYWRYGGKDYLVFGKGAGNETDKNKPGEVTISGSTDKRNEVGLLYGVIPSTNASNITAEGGPATFNIHFSGIANNTMTFTLLSNGDIVAGSGNPTTSRILITIGKGQQPPSQSGMIEYRPYVQVTFQDGGGRFTGASVFDTSGVTTSAINSLKPTTPAYTNGGSNSLNSFAAPSITITPGTVTMKKDETKALTVKAENGPAGSVVEWRSSNPAVATVNANGVVTGVAAGTSVITATYKSGGVTLDMATTAVTVLPTQVTVTIVPPANLSDAGSAKGSTIQLTAEVRIDGVVKRDATVTWTSSDNSIATVTPNGLVTVVGNKDQSFTITAKYEYLNSGIKDDDTFKRKIIETISGMNGLTTIPK